MTATVPTPAKATNDAPALHRHHRVRPTLPLCCPHQDSSSTVTWTGPRSRRLSALVPAGFSLAAAEVKPTEVIRKQTNRKDTAPRDADQKKVDAAVKTNYAKNVAKNHTTDTEWGQLSLAEYIVPPKAVDTVLDYLRRSTGTGGTAAGAQLRYRKGTHGSGNTRIQWAVVTKSKKDSKKEESK